MYRLLRISGSLCRSLASLVCVLWLFLATYLLQPAWQIFKNCFRIGITLCAALIMIASEFGERGRQKPS